MCTESEYENLSYQSLRKGQPVIGAFFLFLFIFFFPSFLLSFFPDTSNSLGVIYDLVSIFFVASSARSREPILEFSLVKSQYKTRAPTETVRD